MINAKILCCNLEDQGVFPPKNKASKKGSEKRRVHLLLDAQEGV
jgi:hypothetical protein